MKAKKVQESNFDIKKWGLFFVFLLGLFVLLLVLLKPEGEANARKVIDRARMANRKAREMTHKSNGPQDMANLDLSTDYLEKAHSLFIESEFTAALDEADKSIRYSDKIINKGEAPAFGAKIRFLEMVGEVLVKKKGSPDFEAATKRMTLNLGDEVRTSGGSSCLLGHKDGTETWLLANGRLTFREDLNGQSTSGVALFLEDGQMNVVTADSRGKMKLNIDSPSGKARIYQETDMSVRLLSQTSEMEVRVRYGRVDAKVGKRTAIIANNQMFTYSEREMEGEPEDMLDSPNLLKPVRSSKFKVNKNGFASVSLLWKETSGADRYYVELSSDQLFVNLVEEKENYAGKRLEFPSLKSGIYFWRVTAIDRLENRGMPSPTFQFEVLDETSVGNLGEGVPPKLKIRNTVVQGNVVIIHGSTDGDATVKLNGESAIVNKEDGSFKHVLKLSGYGVHTVNVVAESSTGSIAFERKTVEIKDR